MELRPYIVILPIIRIFSNPTTAKKRKRAEKRESETFDEDDTDFDDKRPSSAKDPFGASYKKAHNKARNPTPPPTGFQKRKENLTYAPGKKSLLLPPSVSKEDRRKKARKE